MAAPCGHCGQLHEAYATTCPVTGARLAGGTYTLVNGDEILVGNVIGERYHVRDILGQGSTGTVFGTIHAHFERAGAMKVLRPRFTSIDTLQRIFHNEARTAFTVFHPSLCEVYDVGSLPDGSPFFVMEKLEGDTLASRLGRERFSTAAAVDLLMQLLAVMDTIHSRELLLRDLRPQNMFLVHRRGCRPLLKLLDFGLSRLVPLEKVQAQWDSLRAVASDDDHSGALSIPYYLSPERTRSEQGLEPSNDLFVAAVIVYEALAGQRPFNGSTWSALLADIVQGEPIPISVLRPDLPEELSALIMRSLASKPRARPSSAREMQDELRAIFEERKRGSTALRSATAIPVEVAAPAPRANAGHTDSLTPYVGLPASSRTLHTAAPGDGFDDETRTDRKAFDIPEHLHPPAHGASAVVDEASAEHPVRTMRPPGGVDIEVDVDVDLEHEHEGQRTTRGDELAKLLGLSANDPNLEEETATMHLTPEIRARIEQMTRTGAPAMPVDESNRPPPTRRMDKPPSRG